MAFNPKDRFFHKAKAEGFVARSAYKLDELQKKFKIMKPGDFVLDLGAAPGAWTQIASKAVGPQGRVVGLDLKSVDLKLPNSKFYVMNAFDFDPAILEGRAVQCMLSDMAPNTTGIRATDQARSFELCEQVVKLSSEHLVKGGHLVMKLFEGPDAEKLAKNLGHLFQQTKRLKPEAVRKGSFETYFLGLRKL
ncbi:MAG TPA: RlmE family RNA methyltransferase [Bdellovibrionales bacterium]|nr:RlmE family RNA methyltransferase [Bdellovibrionales bacterium]